MEVNFNFKIDPIVVKIDVNPQFTQTLAFLATALGYPGKTIASELKQTAQEAKAKAEELKQDPKQQTMQEVKQEQAKQESKKPVENWTVESITPVLSGYLKKGVTNDDIKRELRKFKDKNNNPIQGIKQLLEEKGKEDIDKFLKTLKEFCKEDSKDG